MKIRLNKALEKVLHGANFDKQTDSSTSPDLLGPFFFFFFFFLLTHTNEIQGLQIYCLEYILFAALPQLKIVKAYFGALELYYLSSKDLSTT